MSFHFIQNRRRVVASITGIGTFFFSLLVLSMLDTDAMERKPIPGKLTVTVERSSLDNAKSPFRIHARAVNDPRTRNKRIRCTNDTLNRTIHILKRFKDFREDLDESVDVDNCKDLFELFLVDLNGDGTREIMLRATTVPFCGAVGNCGFWIFERHGNKYKLLLQASDYVDRVKMGDQILGSVTRGYHDILLRGHFSAGETGFYYMKFNGKKYVDGRCLYEVPNYKSKKLKWHFITCDEFYASLNLNQ